ncbi:MAG: hypothetical protein M4D80_38250 [Myxococcota bacterium]|nr:hypothetical protein [Myxococcota bacterium]
MRIVLAIVIALAAVGCAKKSKPAAAPPAQMSAPAPTGTSNEADKATESGPQTKGDPCDGGETKGK